MLKNRVKKYSQSMKNFPSLQPDNKKQISSKKSLNSLINQVIQFGYMYMQFKKQLIEINLAHKTTDVSTKNSKMFHGMYLLQNLKLYLKFEVGTLK